MADPRWALFAGVAVAATLALLVLSRLSLGTVRDGEATARAPRDGPGGSGVALLVDVALSQAVFGVVLLGGAWYAAIPAAALGIDAASARPEALLAGAGAGIALYAADEGLTRLAERAGVTPDLRLRALLAPESPAGWATLLWVALPAVAAVEELLFRGALIGALAAGFALPAPALAVASAAAFGAAHGAQGRAGAAVAGLLGLALAGVFLATGSLYAAVIAHYLVDALEFLVHEW